MCVGDHLLRLKRLACSYGISIMEQYAVGVCEVYTLVSRVSTHGRLT